MAAALDELVALLHVALPEGATILDKAQVGGTVGRVWHSCIVQGCTTADQTMQHPSIVPATASCTTQLSSGRRRQHAHLPHNPEVPMEGVDRPARESLLCRRVVVPWCALVCALSLRCRRCSCGCPRTCCPLCTTRP